MSSVLFKNLLFVVFVAKYSMLPNVFVVQVGSYNRLSLFYIVREEALFSLM